MLLLSRVLTIVCALLALPVVVRGELLFDGPEVHVNTYTTSNQLQPAVAADVSGGFVIVWESLGSNGNDSSYFSVQGQRYDSTGTADGTEFEVNTYTTNGQRFPKVDVGSDGHFVVVWDSDGSAGTDTSSRSVQAQRYDSTGAADGTEFEVNTYTTDRQGYPDVSASSDGSFVVVWYSDGSAGTDTSSRSVQAQRYDSTGAADGTEFQVNTYTTSDQWFPKVDVGSDGHFVVVWESDGSAGTDTSRSVQAQRYDSTGAADGTEFQVNTYTTSSQLRPAVATSSDGSFVIVWYSNGSSGTDSGFWSVQAQRYDSTGAADGTEFQVNTYTTEAQYRPAVAASGAGGFVVVWQSNGSAGTDTSSRSVQAQRYDSTGAADGTEFQVNTYTTDVQRRAAVTERGDGHFVVVWQGGGNQDGSLYGIWGQLLCDAGSPGCSTGVTTTSSTTTLSTSTSSTTSSTTTSSTTTTTAPPECVTDADCDDLAFCNGQESCSAGVCTAGTAVDCDDHIGCTADACNELTDSCMHFPFDNPCDNGLYCDGVEFCDALLDCQSGTPPCMLVPCDEDANSCVTTTTTSTSTTSTTSTTSSTTTTTLPAGSCALGPFPGCFASAKANFDVKNASDDARDRLTWKWTKGDATSQVDFGDPTAGTDYRLCVYDSSGSVSSVEASVDIAPGTAWKDKDPNGYTYRDNSLVSDGVRSVRLKTGIDTKSKITFKAQGANIPMPTPFDEFLYFRQDPDVTVQLVNSEGNCWTSEFTAANTSKNDGDRFKAKAR